MKQALGVALVVLVAAVMVAVLVVAMLWTATGIG